ncbi:hypothetical protein BKH40_07870 [Helicobacter sp. 11S02629-2]|nr:hypothetical protein BKH40_07870 [Helicobacter sp. 11S02629-2]
MILSLSQILSIFLSRLYFNLYSYLIFWLLCFGLSINMCYLDFSFYFYFDFGFIWSFIFDLTFYFCFLVFCFIFYVLTFIF